MQRPALVIAHNKTLAAQLCNEFREFFPDNAVEYFVSYYDYYQPEAYVPAQDLYIEKDSSINDEIDRLRHSATAALLARRDVVIVASVSCIYGIGSPELYREQMQLFKVGEWVDRDETVPQADRHAVRPQRHQPHPGHVPGQGRDARGVPRLRRDGVPDRALRRRGGVDPALRPADRRGPRRDRPRRGLAGDALRDQGGDDRALGRRDQARAQRADRVLRGAGQAARGAPAAPAHRVRHRAAEGARASRPGSRTTRGSSTAAPRAARRTPSSTTSPTTSSSSSTSRIRRSRSSAGCTRATAPASRRWSTTASGFRRRSTTGRSASRSS